MAALSNNFVQSIGPAVWVNHSPCSDRQLTRTTNSARSESTAFDAFAGPEVLNANSGE